MFSDEQNPQDVYHQTDLSTVGNQPVSTSIVVGTMQMTKMEQPQLSSPVTGDHSDSGSGLFMADQIIGQQISPPAQVN